MQINVLLKDVGITTRKENICLQISNKETFNFKSYPMELRIENSCLIKGNWRTDLVFKPGPSGYETTALPLSPA